MPRAFPFITECKTPLPTRAWRTYAEIVSAPLMCLSDLSPRNAGNVAEALQTDKQALRFTFETFFLNVFFRTLLRSSGAP
jgi:hypothetical protein